MGGGGNDTFFPVSWYLRGRRVFFHPEGEGMMRCVPTSAWRGCLLEGQLDLGVCCMVTVIQVGAGCILAHSWGCTL